MATLHSLRSSPIRERVSPAEWETRVDLAGAIIDQTPELGYSVNAAGYIIHSAVHKARPDVVCVIHTHTRAGIAVGATAEALSGAEITLDNESETNPTLKTDAQKGKSGYGLLEWPALRRRLDRIDPSYCE